MSAIHETAYPRIKPSLNNEELQTLFMPTPEELLLLNKYTKKTLPVSWLGFMILLKCYQYLGRAVKVAKIDLAIKKYIAESIVVYWTDRLENAQSALKPSPEVALRLGFYPNLSNFSPL